MTNQSSHQSFDSPQGRRWLFGLLYLSEGAPMGFIWWALPSLLTSQGIDLATVTKLSATLTLPWVFKFLMGPVIDLAVARGLRIRHFVVTCQIMMGIFLLLLIPVDWVHSYDFLVIALFIHGCFAATQDVGIDALAIRSVPEQELGYINGWMQTGMLGGRALAAASVVALIGNGYQLVGVLLVVALIWLPMIALLIARPDEQRTQDASANHSIVFNWRTFITPAVLVGLWLALTAGAGFEFFTVSVGPLMQQLGSSAENLSLLFGLVAPIGLAGGALAGGYVAGTRNSRTATFTGIIFVALAISLLALLMLGDSNLTPRQWLIPTFPVYLATGFLTAASYTLLMELSRGEYAATRFAVFMSATNGCEVWVTYLGGRLTTTCGHALTLLLLIPISLLAAPALLWLTRQENTAD